MMNGSRGRERVLVNKQRKSNAGDGSPLRRQNVAGTCQWAQRCQRRVAFKERLWYMTINVTCLELDTS